MDKTHEIYKHKHICLVTNHYNPLGIIRSLGMIGIRPIVVLCSKEKGYLEKSRYIGELHRFSTLEDGLQYIISYYYNESLKPFIYNGSDDTTLLLDKHYNELKDHFYFTNGQGGIEKYLQKYEICKLAEECGVRIPKEEFLPNGVLPTTLKYPIITKASSSTNGGDWKADSVICQTPEELTEAYKRIKSKNVLVQEYIVKENEYCVDGISINGGEEVYMPYAASYYRFTKESFGGAMYLYPIKNLELDKKIKEIIKRANFTGIFCIEFLIGKDGEFYFLEVNFRNSGWSYAYTRNGFNLLEHWAKATLDNRIDVRDFKPNEKFNAISEFDDYVQFVQTGLISKWSWLMQLIKADSLFLWSKDDIRPGLRPLISMFMPKFK